MDTRLLTYLALYEFLRTDGPRVQKAEEPVTVESVETVETSHDGLLVAKAFTVAKAWSGEDGSAHIEGWVSTEDRDQEQDVVPPEAFAPGLDEYLQRRAPLSSEHSLKSYPIGHLQRIALVRDGAIFREGQHPTDPADFAHFPGFGTGVYGRGVINDPTAAGAVLKGNVGGFSWVGRVARFERLPDGGRKFLAISPWMESTLAAYPINHKAVLLSAHAHKSRAYAPDEE